MGEFFAGLTSLEKLFFISAVLGGIGVVIRLILQFVGGGDVDADFDVGDADVGDIGDGDFGDSDVSFHLLSLQGIMGFFLMFGLVGLALIRQSGVSAGWALLGGFGAGLVSLWVVAKMFSWMRQLQSSGTLNMKNAVGQEGKVYLTIPASGTGKVEVVVQGRLQFLDAVSVDEEEIKTGDRVQIVNVESGNILSVMKI